MEGYKQFDSREEMLAYEDRREKYYMKFLEGGAIATYKQLFLDTFVPKRRALKKEYDGYFGGWYRDKFGYPCSTCVDCIDKDAIADGSICFQVDPFGYRMNVYVYRAVDRSFILVSQPITSKGEWEHVGGNQSESSATNCSE